MDEQTDAMREHVRSALPGAGAHGFDHTCRVVRLCELLGAREGADMRVLIPAALFHDISRPLEEATGVPHEEEGARMAESFLHSICYPGDCIPGIVHAIRAHRYSGSIAPGTQEARILSDADNLDAMGAVGIARTFLQAGERGARPAEGLRGGIPDATGHIRDKLLNLKALMYTESARRIAERRHAFLTTFLEVLDDEVHARS
ncbi:MAG: HD domain-containing protein [Methanomicrobiaceae archaeon]|nr:HD domain-containing protein [Methanomicrobiaceae archaeon]